MKFTKMHGIGNDYVYINCFEEKLVPEEMIDDIIAMSDRHKGIGSDGVIFIMPSEVADARMRMFNADGSEGKMCGNGIRCVGKYVYEHGISHNNPLRIETASGIKTLNLDVVQGKVESVTVDMGIPILDSKLIPVNLDVEQVINYPLVVNNQEYLITCVSMGNPHCVIFTEGIDYLNLEKIGPLFENNPVFPERINTEFVEIIDDKTMKMRVWERGSGETLACGTGASASVVAAIYNNVFTRDQEIKVILKGGELYITLTSDNHVFMRGSATEVFTGEYKLKNKL
ncbi:MAG TPA: diaminopimelate epimerase [Candidatus Onthocola stercoravium]|nr:diaminopimelate epimerase [Candidatus Onthocola stercoravium]